MKTKKEYQPKHEFAITGVLIAPAVLLEDAEGNEKVKLTVTIPTLQEAWGDRPESVTLHDVTVETRDPQAFDYVLDNFSEKGTFVYLEGEIFREVKRVELESAVDDMGWIKTQFKDKKTGKILANTKYTIFLLDGREIKGVSDNDGIVYLDNLKHGKFFISIRR